MLGLKSKIKNNRLSMLGFFQHRWRFGIACAVASVVVLALVLTTDKTFLFYAIMAWTVMVWVYMLLLWALMFRADSASIPKYAKLYDQGAVLILFIFCSGAVLSFVSMVIFLLHNNFQQLAHQSSFVVLTSFSLIGAWLIVPSAFTMHYAHEFYLHSSEKAPALMFPDKIKQPNYMDFAYFSFTISVANQTADVAVGNSNMRRLVLFHSIIAFIFNTSILGLTINIVAGVL